MHACMEYALSVLFFWAYRGVCDAHDPAERGISDISDRFYTGTKTTPSGLGTLDIPDDDIFCVFCCFHDTSR